MSPRESPKRRLARLLGLLGLTVLLPSITLLWLLNHAVTNERTALQQRFRAFCQDQLNRGAQRWEERWRQAEKHWLASSDDFPQLIEESLFQTAILLDPQSGEPVFPVRPRGPRTDAPVRRSHALWSQARWLELRESAFESAAELYAAIENQTHRPEEARLAWQCRLRCLVKGDQLAAALDLWKKTAAKENHVRLWESAIYLMMQVADESEAKHLGNQVKSWLLDPGGASSSLTISKRLLMMTALEKAGIACPTRAAEELLTTLPDAAFTLPENTLTLTPVADGLWKMLAPDRRSLVFLAESALHHVVAGATAPRESLPISLQAPGVKSESFLQQPLSGPLRGWHISMTVGSEANPFAAGSRHSTRLTTWIAWLTIAAAAFVAVWLSRAILHDARLNRLKNDFLAAVSHELKTPVTAIGLLVDNLLRKETGDPAETREYLGLISRENERLGRLIDNFLSFSRMERHKHSFAVEAVSLQEVMRDAAQVVRERYSPSEQKIIEEIHPTPIFLEGDREALTTVMVNLIDNAMKYSQENVHLGLETRDSQARLFVSDHGIGMNAEERRQAFDKFYRADQSLASETSGVGLGLSIVQFIVRAHRGEVTIESSPGEGSRFTVELPITPLDRNEDALAAAS